MFYKYTLLIHHIGLYVIRGDNITVIGELDDDRDANINLSEIRAQPLKPLVH